MPHQNRLFDEPCGLVKKKSQRIKKSPPRSRTSDPASSKAAAERARKSGLIGLHKEVILIAVSYWPGRTGKHLAALIARSQFKRLAFGLDYVALMRRMKELEGDGLLRRVQQEDRSPMRNYITEAGTEFLEP